jgi:hypothetical protein
MTPKEVITQEISSRRDLMGKNIQGRYTTVSGLKGYDVFVKSNGELVNIDKAPYVYCYDSMSIDDSFIYNIEHGEITVKIELDEPTLFYIANKDWYEEMELPKEFQETLTSEDTLLSIFEGKCQEDFKEI